MELITNDDLKAKIFTIRGIQVMLDRDLALLYGVQTKVLNQAVKRNKERFPESFAFTLNKIETLELVTNCDRLKSLKHAIILIDNYIDETTLLMLSKRNQNCKAIVYTSKISAQLQLDLAKHNEQYPTIEIKQLKTSHDRFLILDEKELYHLGAQLQLDLAKHNEQYPTIEIKTLKTAHDRFLILDEKELYYIGASLKDLGKKWFAFSKINEFLMEVLKRLKYT